MPSKGRRVTSRQVAALAGVSQTTVSFVLNNVDGANISAETRLRVLEAARTLNYVPDVSAQALARGHSRNIALVLSQPHQQVFLDEYVPNLLTGIYSAIHPHGFRIMVEMVAGPEISDVYGRLLKSGEAAGIIVNFSSANDADIRQVVESTASGLPVVSLAALHPDMYAVEVDKLTGVRQIVQHLIELGHRRIGCITYAPEHSNWHAMQRGLVYRQVLRDAGLDVDEAIIAQGHFDPETGYAAMRTILRQPERPTAVFCMNDLMAIGAIRAIHEAGLRVPDDIAVTGFDDIRVAAYTTPPLTTVYEPDQEHGRQAALMLMGLIRGEIPARRQVILDTRVVVRQSCGAFLKQKVQ